MDQPTLSRRCTGCFFRTDKNGALWLTPFAKILFMLSGAAMTALLSTRASLLVEGLGVLFSLAVFGLLAFRCNIPGRVFANASGVLKPVVSALFALWYAYHCALRFQTESRHIVSKLGSFIAVSSEGASSLAGILTAVAAVLSLFAFFTLFYFFIGTAVKFVQSWRTRADAIDRRYLLVCAVIALIAIPVLYLMTNVFYSNGHSYDVVYTSDTTELIETNAYLNISAYQNDVRQPLFGLFSMPFAVAATLVSKLLFFIPNAYPIILGVMQAVLLFFCWVLLANMLRLQSGAKILFLVIAAATYPALLFALNMEQYVFALFWVILLIYASIENLEQREFFFLASAGSLLTSGVFFPLLPYPKGFKAKLVKLVQTGLIFLALVVVFGQLPLLKNAVSSISELLRFSGTKTAFSDKLLQFFNFVATCFVRPMAGADVSAYGYASYQLLPVTQFSIPGAVFLAAAAAGFALNAKDRFAQICAIWVLFSFVLLCLFGWGTAENGLVLYTLYFSWAYVSLVFLAAEKLLKKWKTARYILYSAGAAALLSVNLFGIAEIVAFGLRYYPVR